MAKKTQLLLIILIVAAFVLWLAFGIPHHPVAILKVIDAAGNPVAGAIITPDGLRPKKNGGHYMWTDEAPVKPLPVKTDAKGIARVSYPHYVVERLETGEISFRVDHPDFCPDRPFRTVSASPPANATLLKKAQFFLAVITRHIVTHPDPVVLKRGGILKLAGYISSKENRITNFHPQVTTWMLHGEKEWLPTSDGFLMTRRILEGSNVVRLIYLPTNSPPWFSDLQPFNASSGQTNAFLLELKPGLRLNGCLADSVPRPVANGRVQLEIYSDIINSNHDYLQWVSWRPVNADGTFTFESLPAGHGEIIALCDGFISTNGPNRRTSIRIPQPFKLSNGETQLVIGMQPTATCNITLLDEAGHPLPSAKVTFWPNVIWNDWGSTVFMDRLFKSEDLLRQQEINWAELSRNTPPMFRGLTDKNGVVVVSNLPPFNQPFMAESTNYEMPVITNSWNDGERSVQVQLTPGQTTSATVKMQKKGTDFIHHRQ
ncbi:hypothetical protein [Pedosphaera parvula]|uniref:Carboxypeptidase regulatory-like domain-containing protein n=1 Tax=Pedosphaera parvula (strain Ellin514) TaxID=320771 RepID=B9XPE3_PEDPL|nr:hypothetical protein [Pedosphaera parvula]EEF58283.1 hypothetical protein Cflav_PD1011 [Pedosphaera parvula Ellin514]